MARHSERRYRIEEIQPATLAFDDLKKTWIAVMPVTSQRKITAGARSTQLAGSEVLPQGGIGKPGRLPLSQHLGSYGLILLWSDAFLRVCS